MGIIGITGRQGHGKTYFLTRDAVRGLRAGMDVVSNYPIYDAQSGKSATVVDLHSGLGPLYEFAKEHHSNVHGSLAVVTEIGQIMPARMWQATTTFRFLGELAQSRKRRLHLHYDAQILAGVDKLVRENTHKVRVAKVKWWHPWKVDQGAMDELDPPGKAHWPWLMLLDTYYPEHVSTMSPAALEKHRLKRERHWFSQEWAQAYDTRHIVSSSDPRTDPEGPAAVLQVSGEGEGLPSAGAAVLVSLDRNGRESRWLTPSELAGDRPPVDP